MNKMPEKSKCCRAEIYSAEGEVLDGDHINVVVVDICSKCRQPVNPDGEKEEE